MGNKNFSSGKWWQFDNKQNFQQKVQTFLFEDTSFDNWEE